MTIVDPFLEMKCLRFKRLLSIKTRNDEVYCRIFVRSVSEFVCKRNPWPLMFVLDNRRLEQRKQKPMSRKIFEELLLDDLEGDLQDPQLSRRQLSAKEFHRPECNRSLLERKEENSLTWSTVNRFSNLLCVLLQFRRHERFGLEVPEGKNNSKWNEENSTTNFVVVPNLLNRLSRLTNRSVKPSFGIGFVLSRIDVSTRQITLNIFGFGIVINRQLERRVKSSNGEKFDVRQKNEHLELGRCACSLLLGLNHLVIWPWKSTEKRRWSRKSETSIAFRRTPLRSILLGRSRKNFLFFLERRKNLSERFEDERHL